MKHTIKILSLLLAVLFALSGFSSCKNLPPAETPSGEQLPEGVVIEQTKLPEAYRYQSGVWYLDMKNATPIVSPCYYIPPESTSFDSLEDMKNRLLTLSFTEKHLKDFQSSSYFEYGARVPVIDPRLLYPLKLPTGVTVKGAKLQALGHKSEWRASYLFDLNISEDFALGTGYTVSMLHRGAVGNSYLTMHTEGFIAPGKGYSFSDYDKVTKTTYNGLPALTLEKTDSKTEEKTVYLRYIMEKNDRTYYVEDATTYRDETTLKVTNRVLVVQSFHAKCEYRYTIVNPTEECVENFFEYDPFTYVMIVE